MQHTKQRPLSPHLTIYKPQISSVLSIGHRISGVALFIGLIALIWWIIYLPYMQSPESNLIFKFFSTNIGKGVLLLWSYSLFYHFCTGIRHLFWDCGRGFSIKALHVSSWLAVISSIVLTALSWVIALKV